MLQLLVGGCTASRDQAKLESRSFGKKVGLPGCRITVALSVDEIMEIARKWVVYPKSENDPEWVEMNSLRHPGDELRLVSCDVGDPYFYALIRDDKVVFKYHIPLMD
ncbi:hypothetical protein [Stenotrophomonas sp.]|uniref:hypothetical protein n=1 Tax=Stenotrophomonas sp. TaxID=69392 RepID=UPI00289B0F22|nr:hypothetical protein [Stenotrophomonas sp.]